MQLHSFHISLNLVRSFVCLICIFLPVCPIHSILPFFFGRSNLSGVLNICKLYILHQLMFPTGNAQRKKNIPKFCLKYLLCAVLRKTCCMWWIYVYIMYAHVTTSTIALVDGLSSTIPLVTCMNDTLVMVNRSFALPSHRLYFFFSSIFEHITFRTHFMNIFFFFLEPPRIYFTP